MTAIPWISMVVLWVHLIVTDILCLVATRALVRFSITQEMSSETRHGLAVQRLGRSWKCTPRQDVYCVMSN